MLQNLLHAPPEIQISKIISNIRRLCLNLVKIIRQVHRLLTHNLQESTTGGG